MFNKNQLSKKAILKCPEDYKLDFYNSKCSVTISVGQLPHEQDKLKSTLAVVNSSFKSCTIMLCDSLQRHTLKIDINKTDEEAHEQANFLGDDWLSRNMYFIKQLDIDYNIIRWDYWLFHPEYLEDKKFIDKLSLNNTDFNNALEKTALEFLARNLKKVNTVKEQQNLLINSKEYLKEECAVMLLWAKCGYQFEVYPSQRNSAMDFVYQNVISKTNPKLVRAVAIKFKNISPKNTDSS
jgi:hypothetical protein